MKLKSSIRFFTVMLLLAATLASCKTHKDCRGRKKTAKTQMGGWL